MTERPLLLLDVDGPLNPFGARLWPPRGYVTRRVHPTAWSARQKPGSRRLRRGLRIRLNPAHGQRLLALAADGKLYASSAWTTQGSNGSISGGPGESVELLYVGDGKFIVLSHSGTPNAQ